MNNYYVYIYLDPRKHGEYIYGDYCFLYEPFYIGKGKCNRYKKKKNKYCERKINNIRRLELELIIIKLKENLNENESFILESELIKTIGRQDLNEGPLINFTDGGEGKSGYIPSKKTKKLMSHIRKEKFKNGEISLKYNNNPFYGKKHSDEFKMKKSELMKIIYKGENNPRSILTKNDVYDIKKYLDLKLFTIKQLTWIFDVSRGTISNIKFERNWFTIKEDDN